MQVDQKPTASAGAGTTSEEESSEGLILRPAFRGLDLAQMFEALKIPVRFPTRVRAGRAAPPPVGGSEHGDNSAAKTRPSFQGLNLAEILNACREDVKRREVRDAPLDGPLSSVSPARVPQYRGIRTEEVVASLLRMKEAKRVKPSTIKTYEKRLRHFQERFSFLPETSEPVIAYLAQFNGDTGRHRRNIQDLLTMLYDHAVKRFGLAHNPMSELERILVSQRPVRTASLEQVRDLLGTPQDLAEKAALDLAVGHGWRPVEIRRVTAGDVQAITNNLIEVHGKERRELTPVLSKTAAVLEQLALGLKPEDHIFVARRKRQGRWEPLGEDGMRDLVKRPMDRAGLRNMAAYDLRKTFATLVRSSCGDEFLTMRLLRDQIPGVGHRYIRFAPEQLVAALQQHSPISQTERVTDHSGRGTNAPGEQSPPTSSLPIEKPRSVALSEAEMSMVEAGESRTLPETMLNGLLKWRHDRLVPAVALQNLAWTGAVEGTPSSVR